MKKHFSIYLTPDGRGVRKIMPILEHISKKYKTYAAIKDSKGPHASFTYMDEDVKEDEIWQIVGMVQQKLNRIKPFKVTIDGIRTFRKPYVIKTRWGRKTKVNWVVYLRVVRSKELTRIYKLINAELKGYKHGTLPRFTPHITIARKDIDKEEFFDIVNEYKGLKFHHEFILRHIMIKLRNPNDKNPQFSKIILGKPNGSG
jgi:2''-5'' RNA ligase